MSNLRYTTKGGNRNWITGWQPVPHETQIGWRPVPHKSQAN